MLHLTSASATSPSIKIENTGTEASEPEIIFQRTSTGSASQDIGHIKWKAKDDGGNLHMFANMFADSEDETGGTEDGRMIFEVAKGGTDGIELLRLSGTNGVTFNEESEDLNFRVESNGNANMLFIDGGNDRIGVGTNVPADTLTVNGTVGMTGLKRKFDNISSGSSPPDNPLAITNHHTLWLEAVVLNAGTNSGGNLPTTLPAASSALIGHEYQIIVKGRVAAGGGNPAAEVTLAPISSDVLINEIGTTVANAAGPLTLVQGKIYKVIWNAAAQLMILTLN